jgi:hypothetical protein
MKLAKMRGFSSARSEVQGGSLALLWDFDITYFSLSNKNSARTELKFVKFL